MHRPLVLGKRVSSAGDEWCVASEDCAFGPIGYKRVRDVRPGEMIVITEEVHLFPHLMALFTSSTPIQCYAFA